MVKGQSRLSRLLEKKVMPEIKEQFLKHEDLLKAKEEFVKTGELITLKPSQILEDFTFQIRTEKPDMETFERFSENIKETGGNTQPVFVRKKENKFQLIAGFTRYFACKKHNLPILAIYKDVDDAEAVKIAEAENYFRMSMTFTDTYNRITALRKEGLTLEQIAKRINISLRTVKYYMDLSKDAGLVNLLKREDISFRQAIRLLDVSPALREKEIKEAVKSKKTGKHKTTPARPGKFRVDSKKIFIKITEKIEDRDKVISELLKIIAKLKKL